MLDMIAEAYKTFGFNNFWIRISTHDPKNKEKYIGDKKIWEESEAALEKLIKDRRWKHEIVPGEAAFYGPKLDFIFKDVIGREWQLSTIQLDMNLPKRFELEYTGANGAKNQPVVIHRAILGSTERFLGILIEHYAGAFPLWLAPVQIAVVPVSEKHLDYAKKIKSELSGFRAEISDENETLGKKIRNAELQKIPYVLVVGDKEIEGNSVNVRHYQKGVVGTLSFEDFKNSLLIEIKGHSK